MTAEGATRTPRAAGPPRSQRGIRTLETGGLVLGVLARANGPLKLRDIAELVGMAPSQLHPYLVSFRKIRLVEQNERGLYMLGPFALAMGLSRLRSQNAYRETVRRIPALVEQLQLMVAVTVWGLHGPTIVYVEESPNRIHANVQPGGIFRMTITATGALFAAFLPPGITEPLIRAELDPGAGAGSVQTRVDEAAYRARVAEICRLGYATTRDAPIPGVSAVAAPVFDQSGIVRLAVTLIGPTSLVGLEPGEPAVEHALAFARGLSRDLGHEQASSVEVAGTAGRS